MFVRTLTMTVKPGKTAGLATLVEEKHMPVLREFAGFRDQISMLSPDGKQLFAMSFWDSEAQAETYRREGYPRVLAATEPFIEGIPVLGTYDLIFSTAHHVRSRTAGA